MNVTMHRYIIYLMYMRYLSGNNGFLKKNKMGIMGFILVRWILRLRRDM